MAQTKKYDLRVTQHDNGWSAQIMRRVSATKTTVTKERTDFASEAEAYDWGQQQLTTFTETQQKSNVRHAEQRARQQEVRDQRSQRRSDKTRAAKTSSSEADDSGTEPHAS